MKLKKQLNEIWLDNIKEMLDNELVIVDSEIIIDNNEMK